MNKLKSEASHLFIIPAAAVIAAAGIAPFLEAAATSVFHDVYGRRSFAGADNFLFLLGDAGFGYSLSITSLWATLGALLSLLLGYVIAVKLMRNSGFSRILYAALLVPWGIPAYIAVPLWRALIHGNGGVSVITALTGIEINLMTDPVAGFAACMVVNVWMTVPLTAFVILGALKKIPAAVIEAARIDGAGPGVLSSHIYLPQIRESLAVMGILNFIKAFKEFTLVFLMTAGGPPMLSGITERNIIGATTTLDVFLYEVFNSTDDLGISSAYSVIMAGIVLILMSVWFILKKDGISKRRKGSLLIIAAAAFQPIFGGITGFIPAAGYIAGLRSRKAFAVCFILHCSWLAFQAAKGNFLSTFNPGIIPAAFCLAVLAGAAEKPAAGRRRLPGLAPGFLTQARSVLASGFLLLFILSSAVLMYLLFWMSFSGVSACYMDSLLPPFPGLDNYARAITEDGILRYFLNTLILAGTTSLLIPLISFPAAVYLHSRGKSYTIAALTFVQILGVTGGMHSLIPMYALFSRIGLTDSYIPLVIISLYHSIPFALFTITAYLENLPAELHDIAMIEGLKPSGWLFKVVFPLSKPVVTTAVITAFLSAWNSFMAPLLFLDNDKRYTISLKLYSYVGSIASGTPEWNTFAAAAVINCAVIAVIFLKLKGPAGKTDISQVPS